MKDFLTLARDRYSCRALSPRPVEEEKLTAILEAGLAAPTAKNAQPYRIWVLSGPEAQEKMAQVTTCTFGASTYLIVGCDPAKAWVRPADGRNFADVDGAIVATHLMLAVQDLGLGTTWVGFFDTPKLKALYPQMEPYDLIAIFPVGYPAEEAAPSPRHTLRRPMDEAVEKL